MSITFSTALQKLISRTADSVVEQLMPHIVCIDNTGGISKYLKREITWMEIVQTEDELAQKNDVEIVIVVGDQLVTAMRKSLSKKVHIIYCLDSNSLDKQTDDTIEHNSEAVSVTLKAPEISTILFHIKAILLVSNCVLHYHSKYPIYRYAAGRNKALATMVDKIFQRETVYILLDRIEESDGWYDFLFETLDKRLRPTKISSIPSSKQTSYFCIATSDITQLPQPLNSNRFIAFSDDKRLAEHSEFVDLRRNTLDAESEFAKHYLAAAAASSEINGIQYFKHDHQQLDFHQLKSAIVQQQSTSATVPGDLESFLESHKTLSLPNFMEELEYQILSGLRQKSDRVKGTVNASGIKAVTLHKKMERHHLKKYSEKPD